MKFVLFLLCAGMAVALKPDTIHEQFLCQPRVYYKENECNDCECSDAKKLTCTEKACPNTDPALKKCEINTAWNDGCKKCWCHPNLKTICTRDCHHQELF